MNLFLNPSLEQWADGGAPNTEPDDWINCGGLGLEAVPDACPSAVPETAADGARYGRGYGFEGIGQVVETTPGQTYLVSLSYTEVVMCYGGATSSAWDVRLDEEVLLTTAADVGTDTWAIETVEFTATAASHEICFRKAGGAGGIDALSIVAQ